MSVVVTPFPAIDVCRKTGFLFGILSTYPPTPCGLATFSAALAKGFEDNGESAAVVRVSDGSLSLDPRVWAELDAELPGSANKAAAVLSGCDIAIVQHEYGIYGGTDGDEVLSVLRSLTVPSIVVAHTVLLRPTRHQKAVLEAIAQAASAVVVMAETARSRLCSRFDVDASKVVVIPHGATLPSPRDVPDRSGRPVVLTWGLLGPGKGIEWAIDAMASLQDLATRPIYLVAGRTHPKVFSLEGEAYRDMLVARSAGQGLASSVIFDPSYRDLASLTGLVQQASVVVLPYDSRDQVTSGVLVDAVAAGRPVIATAFPHAVEMLSSGAGLLVPHEDPVALSAALRRVLVEPGLGTAMAGEAARLAPELGWPSVARKYTELAGQLLNGAARPVAL